MEKRKNIAILLSRLIIGGIFIMAGWMKLAHLTETAAQMASLGLPTWLIWVVGLVEFIGGIMIVVGAFTCTAAAALSIVMLFAVYFSRHDMMVVYPLMTLGGLIGLVGSCGGKYAAVCCCKPKGDIVM